MKSSPNKNPFLRAVGILFALNFSFYVVSVQAAFRVAENGKARCVIIRQANATEPERHAVNELAETLKRITGAEFEVQDADGKVPSHAIIVGLGAAAKKYFPEVVFEKLGGEELVIRTKSKRLILAGGRPRGTLYAVNRFLDEQCGVR